MTPERIREARRLAREFIRLADAALATERQLMAYECVPPQVVADDLLGVLTDLAHNPTADATIINTLRRARANVQTFTPPSTVAALVEALEGLMRWHLNEEAIRRMGLHPAPAKAAYEAARAALALHRGEAGR